MRVAGIKPESGKVFFTKRSVNEYFRRIGLTYRKGTQNHSKQKRPEEVDALRELMMLRLLFMMVEFCVVPMLVFQMDETGLQFLMFGEHGRAEKGTQRPAYRACSMRAAGITSR